HSPGPVAITVAGLGLAIAVCTSVFSIVNAVAFRPTGVDDPGSLVRVFRKYQNGIGTAWTYPEYAQLRHGSRAMQLEAWQSDAVSFSATPAAEDAPTANIGFVTGGYLAMLNGRLALGRTLMPRDDVIGVAPA